VAEEKPKIDPEMVASIAQAVADEIERRVEQRARSWNHLLWTLFKILWIILPIILGLSLAQHLMRGEP
jgi:hypothetical protein